MRCRMRTARDRGRQPARARGRVLVRHRRLRRQRAARGRDRRATRRPARTAGPPTASTPTASTPTLAPAGSYRAFGATHMQWIGESQVDEIARRAGLDPLEMRRRNLCLPGEEVRAGGKPLDADLVGDVEKVAAALGWDEPTPAARRPRRLGRAARGRSASRLERDRAAWRPTAEVVVLVGTTEIGQGAAHGVRADRRRGAAASSRARDRARRRHALHAVRPLHRREPLDDHRRPRRPARGRRASGSSSSEIAGGERHRPRRLPRADAQALRLRRRRADRPRRGRAGRHRLLRRRARSSGRSASPPPRSRSIRTPGVVRVVPHGDLRRRGPGHQPAARRAPGRGRDAAGHRQRAVRGDGLRGRPAAQRHAARVPRADASRTFPAR